MKNLLCRHAQLLVIMIISLSLLCLLTAGNHVIRHFEQRLVTDSGEALAHTALQMAGAVDAVVLKGHDDCTASPKPSTSTVRLPPARRLKRFVPRRLRSSGLP